MMIVAILVTMLSTVSAQHVGITVQFYNSVDCSGTPISEATGAAVEYGNTAPYDAATCITNSAWGGDTPISYIGRCSAATDTVMRYTDYTATMPTETRAGLVYCYIADATCGYDADGNTLPTGRPHCSDAVDHSFSVPACRTAEQVYEGWTSLRSTAPTTAKSIKFSCGDQTATPCFPSSATVTLESGHAARMAELRAGDKILAARADGTLYHDTVSRFSLAQSDVTAAFVSLTIGNGKQVSLTATHHLPVGPSKTVKQAADVKLGETVWIAEKAAALAPQTVTKVDVVIGNGLHNPLLVHGGFPVVDGVATSFNTQTIVTLDSYAVPIVEALCAATGTCDSVRKAVASVECTAKHLVHANPVCKEFAYIDGATAGGAPIAPPAYLGAALLAATLATLAWSVRARK